MTRRTRKRIKLRRELSLLLLLTAAIPATAQIVITPSSPPAVNAGQTITFVARVSEGGGVTWSCPGCAGTIDSHTGVYTAPATIHAQQSYGGFQLLPNNHIYNTRIDSLPVNPDSNTWIAGAGTVPVNYLPSLPINAVNSYTPTQTMVFTYTPRNNGPFQIPQYPVARIEAGWFVPPIHGVDRHLLAFDTGTGIFQEMYDYFPAGTDLAQDGCARCTSISGIRYLSSTYDLPNTQGGGVDAAGLYMMPLTLRLQELERAVTTGGSIGHALRMTLQNGYIHPAFVWPATAYANAGMGVNFYGARFRLKSSFDISGFSKIAQILLTQLKQYGLILADGGYGWQISVEYARWPADYLAAFNEIAAARIAPSNFEAVDESGLEVSPTSGLTTAAETVIATGIKNPSHTARQEVVLTGVTLTLPKDELYIQAGTSAQLLAAYIHGSNHIEINWTMSPEVGTLTSAGLYTPPADVETASATTVTAASVADPSVAATLSLTVLPAGAIRLVLGQPTPYTDTKGNVWQNETGDNGCEPYDNGQRWPSTPDIQLYKIPCLATNDNRFDIAVPNGHYLITGKFAEPFTTTAGGRLMKFEAQGQAAFPSLDVYASAGGENLPVDFTMQATVTTGMLSVVIRHVNSLYTIISALQITQIPGGAVTQSSPIPPADVKIMDVK